MGGFWKCKFVFKEGKYNFLKERRFVLCIYFRQKTYSFFANTRMATFVVNFKKVPVEIQLL
jgi:hypothetical protein